MELCKIKTPETPGEGGGAVQETGGRCTAGSLDSKPVHWLRGSRGCSRQAPGNPDRRHPASTNLPALVRAGQYSESHKNKRAITNCAGITEVQCPSHSEDISAQHTRRCHHQNVPVSIPEDVTVAVSDGHTRHDTYVCLSLLCEHRLHERMHECFFSNDKTAQSQNMICFSFIFLSPFQ